MPLLRQVPHRSRKLTIPIAETLEERLENIKRRCQERHMELPFQDAFEAFLGKLIDDAEAELSGAAPTNRNRVGKRARRGAGAAAGGQPAAPPNSGNGQTAT